MFKFELDLVLTYVPPMHEDQPGIIVTRSLELPFPPYPELRVHSRLLDDYPDPEGSFTLKDVIWDLDRQVFLATTLMSSRGLPIADIPSDLRRWLDLSCSRIRAWWTAHPRAAIGLRTGEASGVFALDIDPTKQRRLMLPIKNNVGDDKSGLAYEVVDASDGGPGSVEWEPELVYTTVDEALGLGQGGDGVGESAEARQRRKTQVEEAVEWLELFLAEGPQPASELFQAAKKDGISKRALERAKEPTPDIVSRRERQHWVWQKIDTSAIVEQAKAVTTA